MSEMDAAIEVSVLENKSMSTLISCQTYTHTQHSTTSFFEIQIVYHTLFFCLVFHISMIVTLY